MEVLKGCSGCRICENMCSYNNFKVFQPSKSAIKIYEIEGGFGVELFTMPAQDERPVCNFCKERLCEKYCNVLKGKHALNQFMEAKEAKFKGELL